MQQPSLFDAAAPSLTRTEADRRKAILGLLKDALQPGGSCRRSPGVARSSCARPRAGRTVTGHRRDRPTRGCTYSPPETSTL
jgi:hypothetical protein